MPDKPDVPVPDHLNGPRHSPPPPDREYERSGLYPEQGKAFRIWALLAWLAGIIVILAGVSALLNILFLD